jgi:U32 family peptidase
MPVVFAYPQLFTIRGDLGKRYDFRYFKDRDGDDYELVSSPDTSVVVPAKPFSLVDRIPFLQKDGVTKFIVDFSFMDLKKQIYKRVMAAARDGVILPDTGRFNWKDGFWNPEETATPRNADAGDRQAETGGPGERATDRTASPGRRASTSGGRAARPYGRTRPRSRP